MPRNPDKVQEDILFELGQITTLLNDQLSALNEKEHRDNEIFGELRDIRLNVRGVITFFWVVGSITFAVAVFGVFS